MKCGERRAAIVGAAIRLFAEKGFRGTTTRELAAAVGVSEPVLYRHFQTKKDLYTAIIETKAAEAAQHGEELQRLAGLDDDARFFNTVGETILKYYETDAELIRLLLFSSLERHELADIFFDRLVIQLFSVLVRYAKRRMAAGAFRKQNAEIVARALIGVFAYQGMLRILHPGRLGRHNRSKLVNEIASIFLDGVRVPAMANERLHS
jgi:AcrR family transcriptional regulator